MRHAATVLALAFAVTACGARPDLSPAPGALPAPPGPGEGAAASVAGVTVIARADAWSGIPRRLDEVTPVLVTVENRSESPIRLRYEDFVLVSPTGGRYAALAPFAIRGTEVEPLSRYDLDGFYVAPHLSRYYPWARVYDGHFPYDGAYHRRYHPSYIRIDLPTGDMVQKALPEGVLSPGGRITGYLYFENVEEDDRRVDLRMPLIDAVSGQSFGMVSIPFVVD